MATAPLEQRLSSILPDVPTAPTGEVPLEPFPMEAAADPIDMPSGDPGSPNMDGMQVAGLGSVLRKVVTEAKPSAGRRIVSDAVPADALPEAAKVGRVTVIPEAGERDV